MNSQRPQTNFLKTLTSLRDWATDSYYYINRRNHLSKKEKAEAQSRICAYESYLKQLIEFHAHDTCEANTKYILEGQAHINQIARLYEFPFYPLPDSIVPTKNSFDFILANAIDDSLNNVMFKGDELLCKPVYAIADLKSSDLIAVTYRHNYRTPRHTQVGWYGSLKDNSLVLKYEHPKLLKKKPRWSMSMFDVVHIHKVITISRDCEQ